MRAYRNGKTDVKIWEIREIVSDFFFSCSEKNGEVHSFSLRRRRRHEPQRNPYKSD